MTLGLIITILVLGIALLIVLIQYKKAKTKLNTEIENKNSELTNKIDENTKLNSDLERFSEIVSVEGEIRTKNIKLNELQATAITFNKNLTNLQKLQQEIDRLKELQQFEQKEFSELKAKASNLNDRYTNAKSIFKDLQKDIRLYQNDLEFVELGIYEPIFDLETSEKYQERITQIVTRQKQLIKGGNACVCQTEWVVGNSRKQGEIEQVIKDKYEKEVDFIKVSEAQQFRETQSIIKQIQQAKNEQAESEIEKYPDSLF